KTVFEFASSVLTKYIELKDKINNKYSAETLNIKVSDLLTDYREIKDSKSLFKNKKIKNLIDLLNNELREYRTLDEEVFIIDLITDYREIKYSKSLINNKKIKNLIDLLNNELREYRTLDEEEFINDLKEIQEFQEMRKTLQKRNENFLESFGEAWKGRLTD